MGIKADQGETWLSVKEAKNKTDISHISSVCAGTRKTAGGFIWQYAI